MKGLENAQTSIIIYHHHQSIMNYHPIMIQIDYQYILHVMWIQLSLPIYNSTTHSAEIYNSAQLS
jgi:hypothetical protein